MAAAAHFGRPPAPASRRLVAVALRLCLVLLTVSRSSSGSPPCLPAGITIKAPEQATPGRSFKAKITVANEGRTWLQRLVITVDLPVEATVLKAHPAALQPIEGSPWLLALPPFALAPGTKQTIKIKAVVGRCFQGAVQLSAAASLPPSDPICPPVVAVQRVRVFVCLCMGGRREEGGLRWNDSRGAPPRCFFFVYSHP
jgi:hypothetical protein